MRIFASDLSDDHDNASADLAPFVQSGVTVALISHAQQANSVSSNRLYVAETIDIGVWGANVAELPF